MFYNWSRGEKFQVATKVRKIYNDLKGNSVLDKLLKAISNIRPFFLNLLFIFLNWYLFLISIIYFHDFFEYEGKAEKLQLLFIILSAFYIGLAFFYRKSWNLFTIFSFFVFLFFEEINWGQVLWDPYIQIQSQFGLHMGFGAIPAIIFKFFFMGILFVYVAYPHFLSNKIKRNYYLSYLKSRYIISLFFIIMVNVILIPPPMDSDEISIFDEYFECHLYWCFILYSYQVYKSYRFHQL